MNAESMVCERKDASPSREAELAVIEGKEEELPPASTEALLNNNTSDQKRKLSDQEGFDKGGIPAKKQQIDRLDSISDNIVVTEEEDAVVLEATKRDVERDGTLIIGHLESETPSPIPDDKPLDAALNSAIDVYDREEQPLHDGKTNAEGFIHEKIEAEPEVIGKIPFTENIHTSADDSQNVSTVSHLDDPPPSEQQSSLDLSNSRRVEVPNNKVGVLIGKSGDTIRNLQLNSGAKIQITRDGDNDPNISTRHVELTGSLESINKAEQLIKDVIAEANAGGSPALVARGFSTSQTGGEQIEIQIPGDKVGVLIGKGGETIRSLQTKTSARIQLLPQSDGDSSKERTVRITGNANHVESARDLIKGVVTQVSSRLSSNSNSYSQSSFRPPRGSAPSSQWGPRGSNINHHSSSYNHQQRVMYPSQTTQYPQSHGGYSQQHPPPRAWELTRPSATPLQSGYYNHGGTAPNTFSNPLPTSAPASTNFNYGRSQAPDNYGNQAPYAQPPPAQQSYGHVYSEPNIYGQQQPAGLQPGAYGQQSAASYGKPAYGATNEVLPVYGQPRISQPGDSMYQGPQPSQYPAAAPMQQSYPYASNALAQQPPSYNQAYSGHADGYSQQVAAGYSQQGGQPIQAYGQGGQVAPVAYNAQSVLQPVGYCQYPSSQPAYGDPIAQANVNYGYQGVAVPDAGYTGNVPNSGYAGNVPNSGYAAPSSAASQPGYSQPQLNPSGYYDQSMVPQQGYGATSAAQASYGKTGISPQPGYGGGQYDATQMYGQQ